MSAPCRRGPEGEVDANIYPAGYHAFGSPMQIEVDTSAPADEWRVHLGSASLDEKTTVSAEDIADLEAAAVDGQTPAARQAAFDTAAASVWPGTYAGFSAAIKSRNRWAWANRP